MTDDTIASPEASDTVATTDSDTAGTDVAAAVPEVLVEEISIDGMCGVY